MIATVVALTTRGDPITTDTSKSLRVKVSRVAETTSAVPIVMSASKSTSVIVSRVALTTSGPPAAALTKNAVDRILIA